ESKNSFHFSAQLVGKIYWPRASAVGPALMLEAFEFDSKCAIELCDSAGENYATTSGIFLDDRKTVGTGELLYLLDIAFLGTEFLREFFAFDVLRSAAGAMKLLQMFV